MAELTEMFIGAGSVVFAFVMTARDVCFDMQGAKRIGAEKRF